MDGDNFVTTLRWRTPFAWLGSIVAIHWWKSRPKAVMKWEKPNIRLAWKLWVHTRKYRIGCYCQPVGGVLAGALPCEGYCSERRLSLPFITDYETFLRTDKREDKLCDSVCPLSPLNGIPKLPLKMNMACERPIQTNEYKEEETTRRISEQRRDSSVDGDTYHKKEDEHGAWLVPVLLFYRSRFHWSVQLEGREHQGIFRWRWMDCYPSTEDRNGSQHQAAWLSQADYGKISWIVWRR